MTTTTPIKPQLTLDEFLELPETKPYNEYFNRKIEQKLMPQGQHSVLQGRLVTAINEVMLPEKLGHAFPELRCNFGGMSIVPDISILTWNRIPRTPEGKIANRFNLYPDWVIEILSPEQSSNKIVRKVMFCLSQGTKIAWLIDPEDESVMIFKPEQFPEIKLAQEILPVLEGLEGLQLSVKDMFDWLIY
jgi:Uma2 family endonuclease